MLLGSLGESNGEESQDETIGGLGLDVSLDKGMPFFDHGACLVSGDVHTIEVGVAIESLDFVNLEFKSSPCLSFCLIVAISERDSVNTTFQVFGGLLLSDCLVCWGKCNASLIEAWGKDVVPFFFHEWMGTKEERKS